MVTMTKTKIKTSTKVAVAAVGLAAAAGALFMSTALFMQPVNDGESLHIRGTENVEFLTIKFRSSTRALNISTLTFDITADDDADFTTVENDVVASEHLTNCTLRTGTGRVYMGPLDPDVNNQVVFMDDFRMPRNTVEPLTFTCDFTASETNNSDPDAFAVTLAAADVDATFLKGGIAVKSSAIRPMVSNADLSTYVVKTDEGSLTAELSSSSPSGTGFVPGDQEAFRFTLSTGEESGVEVDLMTFNLATTDNDGTGWNHCGTTGLSTSDFTLYNLSTDGLSSALPAAVAGYDSSGANCTTSSDPSYLRFTLSSAESIPAGTSYIYVLYINSDGASASSDDALQVGIPYQSELDALGTGLESISWSDDAGTAHDGTDVVNLPITGGAVGF